MDLQVLLARLVRVLMRVERQARQARQGGVRVPETEEEMVERIVVRNACLDEPFFQRAWGGQPPFGDDPSDDADDEGNVL